MSDADPGLQKRIVIAGEFSSGKSSVANLLLRRPILLPSVGLNHGPLIHVRHGHPPATTVEMSDGTREDVPNMDAALRREQVSAIEITTPISTLSNCEIIEMQAPSSGAPGRAWIDLASSADMLIWCTIASQAWRLSEKECAERLPEQLRNNAVLAVTRSDLLRSASDVDKIEKRLIQDAGAFFRDLVFVHAGGSTVAQLHDDDIWKASGGETLVSLAETICAMSQPKAKSPEPESEPGPQTASSDQADVTVDAVPAATDTTAAARSEERQPPAPQADLVPQPSAKKLPDTPQEIASADPALAIDLATAAATTEGSAFSEHLDRLSNLPGFIAACIVETETAERIAATGTADFNELCSRSSLFLRLQMVALPAVSGDTTIEDILISTRKQFQLLRAIDSTPRRHIVLIVSRDAGNLGQSRIALRSVKN